MDMAFVLTTPVFDRRPRLSTARCSNKLRAPKIRRTPSCAKAREVTAEELEKALQDNSRPIVIDAFASAFDLPFDSSTLFSHVFL